MTNLDINPGNRAEEKPVTGAEIVVTQPNEGALARRRILFGFTFGDALLQLSARIAPPELRPDLQAQAVFHQILTEALIKGIRPLGRQNQPLSIGDAILEMGNLATDQYFTPPIFLEPPVHDTNGAEVIDSFTGRPKTHLFYLRFPLKFPLEQLAENGRYELVNFMSQHGSGSPRFYEKPARDDLIRIVAGRMSKLYDYDQLESWLLSERAVNQALKGPSLGLPAIN